MHSIRSSIFSGFNSIIDNLVPIKYRNRPRFKQMRVKIGFYYWRLLNLQQEDAFSIPIIINNFNRVTFLKKLINSLERLGYRNIHIIDNNSSYPPLLDYYKMLEYPIYYLPSNVGYKALWETGLYKKFWNSYYVYTDSDVMLDDKCPKNFMKYLVDLHTKYPSVQKIGLGIHIDDLPVCFSLRNKIINHEKQFWLKEVECGVYEAWVDTTFALYKPYGGSSADGDQLVFRTGHPYIIHHLPWYADSANLSEEDKYYINCTTQSTHWTNQLKKNVLSK